jgi:hypothetical protein
MKRYFCKLFMVQLGMALVLGAGCNKKEETRYYVPEYLKQYALFKEGSYWIYKNEITGDNDSNYITIPPLVKYTQYYSYDPICQTCETKYEGNPLRGSFLTNNDCDFSFSITGGYCLLNRSFNAGFVFKLDQYDTYKELMIFDSLQINGNNYRDVLNTQYIYTTNNNDSTILTFYLVKGIGLVKFNQRINDKDTTWSLIRCNAKQ